MSYLGTDTRGSEHGRTYFVGGAGGIGNAVGTVDVPKGLREARYKGSIEVFAWQAVLGGTLRDLVDRDRNEGQARRLAARIEEYMDAYPGRRVNIVALSAGTGIATWALEALPKERSVGTVVFLGSALSRNYDLSAAMQKIDGHLYCFYSADDPLLRYGLPITGSVDRKDGETSAAGLYGFTLPAKADNAKRDWYRSKLRNRPYKSEYAAYGYYGLHADSTSPQFIAKVVYPLLCEELPGGQRTRAARQELRALRGAVTGAGP